MSRTARAAAGGFVYHVLNRGNYGQTIFRKDADYAAFADLLLEGKRRANVEVFGYCLMRDHWHLVLRPAGDKDLARYMSWVTNTHVKRHRQRHPRLGPGHLYQGRYKSFPVQGDAHLLTVLHYVEANPLRGGLVRRAERWPWSSLGAAPEAEGGELLSRCPVDKGRDWAAEVNRGVAERELDSLRTCVERGRPYGSPKWLEATVRALGLGFTVRGRGRPPKADAPAAAKRRAGAPARASRR